MTPTQKKLDSFTKYIARHPEQRFWQAIRNWARDEETPDIAMILVSTGFTINPATGEGEYSDLEDTFNWE